MVQGQPATRTRLIHAAIDRLSERSYFSTGVDELCRVAAAKKGSFYHFFRSKTDLAVAALEFQWTTMREEVFEPLSRTGAPGLDRLRRLVERIDFGQRLVRDERPVTLGSPFGSLGQEMAHQDEQIRASVQNVFDGHCRYLQTWLDEAARARQIPPGDTALRARQVLALIEGALLLSKVAGNPDVFVQICAALPTVAGRSGSSSTQATGIAPELL